VSRQGAIRIHDIDSLERTIAELLCDSEARERLVQSAREVLSEHQGATARTAALIHELNPRL
jgi:3-deoxy-D-manno-octulosonic-acid transferase